jgi:hypothetical protein
MEVGGDRARDFPPANELHNESNDLGAYYLCYSPFQLHHGGSSKVITVGSRGSMMRCVVIKTEILERTPKWIKIFRRELIYLWTRSSDTQVLGEEVNQPIMFLAIGKPRLFITLGKVPEVLRS